MQEDSKKDQRNLKIEEALKNNLKKFREYFLEILRFS